ncbi:MAG: hypothetical protein L6R38_008489 [Xanthoria sp. 2 TBL-2021]|nr:MAG: hypothetical protein L6R38_008489 [Xanthoria sp. 2 TBL-2021]
MSTPALETLTPEVQAQIMRNIGSVPAFISLLRASPRFYQVFRNRKEYLLTQLAFNQFHPGIIDDVWTLAKAFQIPQPVPTGDIGNFISKLALVDHEHQQHSIPTSIIAPLCKIGPTIAWFAEDYRDSSLRLLTEVGTHMEIKQDYDILHSEYSITENGRVQRALCRFETFCHLFFVPEGNEVVLDYYIEARRYLLEYLADDVEEIACIRDYLVRRLWGVFEAMEERALHGDPDSAIRKLGKACQPVDWFSGSAKLKHSGYMEYIMSKGLRFIREVLESDGLKGAELVMNHSFCREFFISHALSDEADKSLDEISLDYNAGTYDGEGDYVGDDLDALSQGLLWANHGRIPSDWGRWPLKGLRDWGYVFWDKRRLEASGVLDME